jgi:hypothetical protein
MAWGFRRSVNFGPLRINASKSGLGYSFGGRGFRIGKDARGRKYTSTSIPGTGIYNRTYSKPSKPATSQSAVYTYANQQKPASGNGGRLGPMLVSSVPYAIGALAIFGLLKFVLHLI